MMTLIMKRSQSKGGKVQCSSSHNRKKKLTPTDQRWQPAGTCNITGPGTCLHLGQLLPGRSLRRLLCHFGKNPPPEGWLLRISEGVTLVLLQLGGMPGPRQTPRTGQNTPPDLCCPVPHSYTTHSQAAGAPRHPASAAPRIKAGASQAAQEGRAPRAGFSRVPRRM